MTAAKVLSTAASQIGTKENPLGSNRVPYWELKPEWNGSAWCQTFVQWSLKRNGYWLPCPLPYYVPSAAQWAKDNGVWLSSGSTPRPGDLVVFGSTGYSHIGFVERVNADGTVQTIEGNTSAGTSGSQTNGDGVYRRTRSRSWIRGFIRMSAIYSAPAPDSLEALLMSVSLDDIANAVWDKALPKPGNDRLASAKSQLGLAHIYAYRNNGIVTRLEAQIAGLSAAVEALAASNGMDGNETAALVERLVRERLAAIKVEVVVDDEGDAPAAG